MSALNRREFLATTAVAALCGAALSSDTAKSDEPKPHIHKALIGIPDEATLEAWKAAGFEGYESQDRAATPAKAVVARKLAEKLGLRIHSVMYGWANFNQPDKFKADLKSVETALRVAADMGADTVLLVPCRIDGHMPEAWEFDIRFDEKTGHLKQVVKGDNGPYAEYLAGHDRAADGSVEAVKRLIPVAEKQHIIIALENVWNNLWTAPEFFRNFVASFDSPWVRAYFDIGNHVKYAPPEKWIRTLGKLIVKCHVKDFKLNADGHGGTWTNIRDGSVNWPAVRKALDEIGYNGWASIEGGSLSPMEGGRRLDLILAG